MKFRAAFPILLLAVVSGLAQAQRTSPLSPTPNWKELDPYQDSITRSDFVDLLEKIYAPKDAWKPYVAIGDTSATIQTRTDQPPYVLRFASSEDGATVVPHFWRPRAQMPVRTAAKPLAGVRITLDPGHIGGEWAKMEERWFQIGNSKPVMEGEITLAVARLLVPRLEALGADVSLTRSTDEPVTSLRPEGLLKLAPAALADNPPTTPGVTLEKESEWLFYREAEIRRRAEIVNHKLKPDLVVCLHVNAEPWGDPTHPVLTDKNHVHVLVNGCYSALELGYEDQRLTMLKKLLGRAYREEAPVARAVAAALAAASGLPPYIYTGDSAFEVDHDPYVWARNLAANRLFECPVVFVEPYVMNSHAVFDRIEAGDYDGTRVIDGRPQKSIYREYADSVAQGLAAYYSHNP